MTFSPAAKAPAPRSPAPRAKYSEFTSVVRAGVENPPPSMIFCPSVPARNEISFHAS